MVDCTDKDPNASLFQDLTFYDEKVKVYLMLYLVFKTPCSFMRLSSGTYCQITLLLIKGDYGKDIGNN